MWEAPFSGGFSLFGSRLTVHPQQQVLEARVADFGGWVMSFAWFCLVLLGFVGFLGSLLSNHSFLI